MDGLIIILVIIFFVVSQSKKKKKQGAKKGGNPPAGQKPSFSTEAADLARQLAEMELGEDVVARLRSAFDGKAADAEAPASIAPPIQGVSADDDEGCLGGSMEHEHTEGEPRQEHARHIASIEAREAAEAVHSARDPHPAGFTAADMRRAVITAEILNRPKALRRRTTR